MELKFINGMPLRYFSSCERCAIDCSNYPGRSLNCDLSYRGGRHCSFFVYSSTMSTKSRKEKKERKKDMLISNGDSLTQNDSFDEKWSLNPSEGRNSKVKKSIEISIQNGRKPYRPPNLKNPKLRIQFLHQEFGIK